MEVTPPAGMFVPGRFTVVIPTLNEGAMLVMTTHSVVSDIGDDDVEVIVVDDGSTDGSTAWYERYPSPHVRVVRASHLGVARARNLGASHATGEYLVFLDAHCRVSPGWLRRLRQVLRAPGVGVAGPCFTRLEATTPRGCGMFWSSLSMEPHWIIAPEHDRPYHAPLSTGACQAFRRDVFTALGRYDEHFTRWGFEDVEICLRAWLSGLRVVVDPGVTVAHHFRDARGYEVDDNDVAYNFLRMLHLHLSPQRVATILRAHIQNPAIAAALPRLYADDTFTRRAELESRRAYSDDWFFTRINPPGPLS